MSEFSHLTEALEGWFETPMAELPEDLRLRVEDEFLPMPWDRLTAAGRRDVARQIDFDADPGTEAYRRTSLDYADRRFDLEARIKVWQNSATPTATDLKHQAEGIESLQRELAELDDEFKGKFAGFDAKGHALPMAGSRDRPGSKVGEPELGVDLAAHRPIQRQDAVRKHGTQARHRKWQSEYRKLKKSKPNMSDTWYATQIWKGPHSHGRSAETIRKNMKK